MSECSVFVMSIYSFSNRSLAQKSSRKTFWNVPSYDLVISESPSVHPLYHCSGSWACDEG